MSARGAAAAAGVFFLDFIPNCFLVSYSCTAYKVYSTVVQLFEFNEALPRLQVFLKKIRNQRTSGSGFWKKRKKKDKFKTKKIIIKESSILIFEIFYIKI